MMWLLKAFISFWLSLFSIFWAAGVNVETRESLVFSILGFFLAAYAIYTAFRFAIWFISKIINLTQKEIENG